MNDKRWPQLKGLLVDSGWELLGEVLYSPNRSLWFTVKDDDPDYSLFNSKLTEAMSTMDNSENLQSKESRQELRADLKSLIDALDVVLSQETN